MLKPSLLWMSNMHCELQQKDRHPASAGGRGRTLATASIKPTTHISPRRRRTASPGKARVARLQRDPFLLSTLDGATRASHFGSNSGGVCAARGGVVGQGITGATHRRSAGAAQFCVASVLAGTRARCEAECADLRMGSYRRWVAFGLAAIRACGEARTAVPGHRQWAAGAAAVNRGQIQ